MLWQGCALQRLRRGRVALVALAMIVALGSAGMSAARGSRPFNYCAHRNAVFRYRRPFLGISDVSVEVNNGTPYSTLRDCSMGQMVAAGIGYYREFIDWKWIEIKPNVYNFATLDGFEAAAAEHHMKVLGMVFNAPAWRSSAPATGALPGFYPPANPQDFAYFTSLLVRRYGPNGTFWRENPQLPYDPTHAWQVWNEPNLAQSWEPHTDLAAYVRLLKATSVAIRRVDPHAIVVTGGIGPQTRNLSALYRFGGRRYFNVLAIHDYAYSLPLIENWMWSARRVMKRFGDGNKPMWITEIGWSGGSPNLFVTNARKQRVSEDQLFRFVRQARQRLGLRQLFWYSWQDRRWAPGPANWWGFNEGFFTTGLRPKPSFAALKTAGRRLDR
jgi:hypothetical protein